MRVCFLLHQGNMFSGGQGVYLYYLTRELARMGHDVHAVVGAPYPELAPGVHLHPLKQYSVWSLMDEYDEHVYGTHPLAYLHPLNLYEFASTRVTLSALLNLFSLRAYALLNELERDGPFDLIHDNQVLGYGTWLMKVRGRAVVANVHHPLSIDRENELAQARTVAKRISRLVWFPWEMQRWVARRVDRVITGSQSAAASVAQALRLPPEHIRVIYDGVDEKIYRPLDDVEREPCSLLFVGRAEDKNKGFRYLLEALKRLDGVVPYHLIVVQPPKSREAARQVEELGLRGRFTYLERLSSEELVHTYNRVQVHVTPSLYEGFGLPAAEAQACGTAEIATSAGALPEIVDDGVSGLVVPPGQVEPLVDALRTLLQDPARCRAMGEAGSRRIRERFTWRRTAEETLALYHEVLRCRERASGAVR